jgi:glycolate oxidase FAD binding subunit
MSAVTGVALDQLLGPLRSIVGDGHARLREGTIVVLPEDASQIAHVLRFALANGLPVTPVGGGTKLQWGNPVRGGIELGLQHLAELREHAWQDMTCTVQAGCSWAAMQSRLAQHGQMVALDPLWPERATVGGIISTNDSGAQRLKFGGLRDLIIGMTVVIADGTIAKSGGKVVKNVAGYDLHKLMTGSFGTLGVIAEVNFRLHPVEVCARTWTVTTRGQTTAAPMAFAEPLLALLDSQLVPSGVQLRTSTRECALDVRIAGIPECFDEYDGQIRKIFNGFQIAEENESVWQERQRIFDSGFEFVFKITVLPGQVCAMVSGLQKWAQTEDAALAVVAQATGVLIAGLTCSSEVFAALIERLRTSANAFGGSAIVLRLPGQLRSTVDVWGPQSDALPLMREIKRRFDPERILNPGRFVGNI